jgi:protein-disulfide isomerase
MHMKNYLTGALSLLLLADLSMQSLRLYKEHTQRPQPVSDAPPGTTFRIDPYGLLGAPQTTKVVIEFSDYECPFCNRHATSGAGPEIQRQFVDAGRVRYAFLNNPLPIHLNARLLAAAGICASGQNRFSAMHDALFAKRPKEQQEILSVAEGIGLNRSRFEDCLTDRATETRITRDIQEAEKLGLTGTPSFVVGTIDEQGVVHVKKMIRGAQPLEVFERAIAAVSEE